MLTLDKILKNNIYPSLKYLSSVKKILTYTANYFEKSKIWFGHGTNNAWDEAYYLIFSLISNPDNANTIYNLYLNDKEKLCLTRYIKQRVKKRVPIAYLVHKAWFCDHQFYVDNRTIIPRSPIAELIKNRFNKIINYEPKNILDLCTGSGCIAISCSYVFPHAKIDATDISLQALQVTKKNIGIHHCAKKVSPIFSNLFYALKKEKYDLIISNPPYVSKKIINTLPSEYHHEPRISLLGGHDGLKFIHRILKHAAEYLTHRGILICEVGNNMNILIKQYPNINFTWLKFKYGGTGIFMLNKKQLTDGMKNKIFHFSFK